MTVVEIFMVWEVSSVDILVNDDEDHLQSSDTKESNKFFFFFSCKLQ